MQKNIYSLKKEIVAVGRRVYERGYVASNDGNISAKIDDERILITPTGVSKGFMKPEDLIVLSMDGKVLNGDKKPSSEFSMHIKMYEERPDVFGVCHAHPPYATGFAVAGIPLDQCVLPEVIVALGGIPIAEYGLPGTDKLFEPVLKYVHTHDAFLLENHGALTIGEDVLNAYHKMETMEHFAHILFVSRMLGNVNTLNEQNVGDLLDLRKKFGITTDVGCAIDPVPKAQGPSSQYPAKIDEDALVKQITDAVLKQLK
ncbi:MAG: class II aldolase/adducin family protein [Deferribacteres bacterium]|nr:class II aldolase/adducin family protein [candidate division KSB1 bacterium]MCB9502404.1 class II aldolase/adducin family protein [Deferribacteres bacterium]